MSGRGRSGVAVMAPLLVLVAACNGYGQLDVPVRETGVMVVESQELFAGRLGTVQVRIDLPDDVTGPLFIIGSPSILSSNATDVNWAHGPCGHPDAPVEPTPSWSLRLCVAVAMQSGVGRDAPFTVFAIVEDRAGHRRFDVTGEVTP